MTFHLHTETRDNLATLAATMFEGFTLTHGTGYWQGTSEPSTIIEVTTDDRARVLTLAEMIRQANHQTAVLVEEQSSVPTLVDGADHTSSADFKNPNFTPPTAASAEFYGVPDHTGHDHAWQEAHA